MQRIKTGYYDRTGKNICDGDKVKAIVYNDGLINLKFVDDIEILERD